MRINKDASVFLDLVRGVSAQLVLIGHLLSFFQVKGFDMENGGFLMQNFGVVVFFILSGFLITYSIDNKNESYRFIDYFIDRFSRIFLAFIPALVFIFLCDVGTIYFGNAFSYKSALTVKNFIGNAFMMQDHPAFVFGFSKIDESLNITSFGSGRPLWTVGIEWWIYMFFGFIAFKKLTIYNFLIFCFLCLVPLFNMSGVGNGLTVVWFLGMLGYYFVKYEGFKPRQINLVILLLLIVSLFRLRMNNYQVYDLTFSVPLTFAMMLYIKKLQNLPTRKPFFARIERYSKLISSYSFSLYLIHYSLIILIISMDLQINKWILIALSFLFCNLIAWVFASLTEFKYHSFRNIIKNKYRKYVGR